MQVRCVRFTQRTGLHDYYNGINLVLVLVHEETDEEAVDPLQTHVAVADSCKLALQ